VAVDDSTAAGEKWVTRKVSLLVKLIGPIESSRRGDEENGITLFDWWKRQPKQHRKDEGGGGLMEEALFLFQ
jgi:hypothetical protein